MIPRPAVQGPGARAQLRLPLTAERRGMLGKVHIARKQLGLDEATYRALVLRVTKVESTAQASDAALHRLLAEFQRLGFRPSRRAPAVASDKRHVRLIGALWSELAPYLTDASPEALRAFCKRQTGVDAPEFLGGHQANKVIEALKAWLAREAAKGAPKTVESGL